MGWFKRLFQKRYQKSSDDDVHKLISDGLKKTKHGIAVYVDNEDYMCFDFFCQKGDETDCALLLYELFHDILSKPIFVSLSENLAEESKEDIAKIFNEYLVLCESSVNIEQDVISPLQVFPRMYSHESTRIDQ